MANDAQKTFYRTRVVKLLETAGVILALAEEQADHKPAGRARPILPAGWRNRVGALVIDFEKRKAIILADEVT